MSRHHDRIKNDPRWKQARRDCLARDGYACTECAGTERLEVDHIIPLAEVIDTTPDLAFDLENLRTLCRDCHELRTTEGHVGTIERHEWVNPKYIGRIAALVF